MAVDKKKKKKPADFLYTNNKLKTFKRIGKAMSFTIA
jgi:hypothetical protein